MYSPNSSDVFSRNFAVGSKKVESFLRDFCCGATTTLVGPQTILGRTNISLWVPLLVLASLFIDNNLSKRCQNFKFLKRCSLFIEHSTNIKTYNSNASLIKFAIGKISSKLQRMVTTLAWFTTVGTTTQLRVPFSPNNNKSTQN